MLSYYYSWATVRLRGGGRQDLRVAVRVELAPGSSITVRGIHMNHNRHRRHRPNAKEGGLLTHQHVLGPY